MLVPMYYYTQMYFIKIPITDKRISKCRISWLQITESLISEVSKSIFTKKGREQSHYFFLSLTFCFFLSSCICFNLELSFACVAECFSCDTLLVLFVMFFLSDLLTASPHPWISGRPWVVQNLPPQNLQSTEKFKVRFLQFT